MAQTEERKIKTRLKKNGWRFSHRDGPHDQYVNVRHPDWGTLSVSYDKTGRALKDLYQDIDHGPVYPGQTADAQAKPVSERQPVSVLAHAVGFPTKRATNFCSATNPPITYQGRKYWLRRDEATEEERAAMRAGRRGGRVPVWLYWLEEATEPVFTEPATIETPAALQDTQAQLKAAEELLEEASAANEHLSLKLKDRRKEARSLHKAQARLKKELEGTKRTLMERTEELGDLRMTHAELVERHDELRSKCLALDAELTDAVERADLLAVDLGTRETEIEKLEATVKALRDRQRRDGYYSQELEESEVRGVTIDDVLLHTINHLAVALPERWEVEIAELRRVLLRRMLP